MAELVHSERVDAPDGRRVNVLFYDDGSYRFRIPGSNPLVLEEVFFAGKDKVAVITLGNPRRALNGAQQLLREVELDLGWVDGHRELFRRIRSWMKRYAV